MTSARQVDDKCEFAWETLGQIMIQRDDMAKAVQAFDKVSIYQDHLKSNANIGLIQVKEEGWTGFSEGWQGCSEGFLGFAPL